MAGTDRLWAKIEVNAGDLSACMMVIGEGFIQKFMGQTRNLVLPSMNG